MAKNIKMPPTSKAKPKTIARPKATKKVRPRILSRIDLSEHFKFEWGVGFAILITVCGLLAWFGLR